MYGWSNLVNSSTSIYHPPWPATTLFFLKSFCVCVMEQSWYKQPQRSIYLSRQSSAKFVKFITAFFFFLQTIHLSPCHFAGSYAGVWQSLHRWHTGWGRTLPVGCWRQLHQFHPPPSLLPWTCCGHSSHSAVCTVHLLSLIHIWRCRRLLRCRSRWSPYH